MIYEDFDIFALKISYLDPNINDFIMRSQHYK